MQAHLKLRRPLLPVPPRQLHAKQPMQAVVHACLNQQVRLEQRSVLASLRLGVLALSLLRCIGRGSVGDARVGRLQVLLLLLQLGKGSLHAAGVHDGQA